jgi:hypothetical protein
MNKRASLMNKRTGLSNIRKDFGLPICSKWSLLTLICQFNLPSFFIF